MKKVLNPGVTRDGALFLEVEFRDGRLSITGVAGPRSDGDAKGSCGQVVHYLSELVTFSQGWDAGMAARLAEVWDRWHLNDMCAGSPAQEAWVRAHRDECPGYPVSFYEWACQGLEAAGLHPDPDTGYRYGSEWLAEDVPADVLEWLAGLPESSRAYPWRPSWQVAQ